MKKIYLKPSLKIREIDECLLAGSIETVQPGGKDDGNGTAGAKQQSFSEEEEYSPSSVNIWD